MRTAVGEFLIRPITKMTGTYPPGSFKDEDKALIGVEDVPVTQIAEPE